MARRMAAAREADATVARRAGMPMHPDTGEVYSISGFQIRLSMASFTTRDPGVSRQRSAGAHVQRSSARSGCVRQLQAFHRHHASAALAAHALRILELHTLSHTIW